MILNKSIRLAYNQTTIDPFITFFHPIEVCKTFNADRPIKLVKDQTNYHDLSNYCSLFDQMNTYTFCFLFSIIIHLINIKYFKLKHQPSLITTWPTLNSDTHQNYFLKLIITLIWTHTKKDTNIHQFSHLMSDHRTFIIDQSNKN